MPDIVNDLDAAAWDRWEAFVDACPEATFFHKAGWSRVIEDSFGQQTHFLYAERDGEIRGVLPLVHVRSRLFGNRLVSNAFCVGGGPAAVDDQAAAALDRRAEELLESLNAEYIEYRDPARPHADWGRKEGLYASFDRPIEADEDANLKQIPRKQRAVVRKALKSDLTDEVDEDMGRCWELFALGVRNLGTPVFARRYFDTLKREFGDACDALTVCRGGRPLTSVLNFYFRDRVMPYYTGAEPEARRLGAADFMYWRLMRRAVERGYTVFDFGRSKLGTGPHSFKKNWGFEGRPVALEFKMKGDRPLPDVNPNNPKYRMMIAAWKRLPLPVANLIGPIIGRQVG